MTESLFAEYASMDDLMAAVTRLRDEGYREVDTYTPYSSEKLRETLHQPRSRLPIWVFAAGMLGAGFTYFVQWLAVAYLYPVNVGGRPAHMPLAFMVITFEMGILAAAFTAFFGVLIKARLLRLYDPVFEVEGIESASVDGHWLRLSGSDRLFHLDQSRRHLDETRPLRIVHHGARS